MIKEEMIASLQIHKNNLLKAKTLEEYKAAHIAYIDFLLEDLQARLAKDEAKEKFASWNLENEE